MFVLQDLPVFCVDLEVTSDLLAAFVLLLHPSKVLLTAVHLSASPGSPAPPPHQGGPAGLVDVKLGRAGLALEEPAGSPALTWALLQRRACPPPR